MTSRIDIAKEHYATRFPEHKLEFLRGFEDRDHVLVQFLHGTGDGTATPMGTEIFEFSSDGSTRSVRQNQSTFYHTDMYGSPIEPGPTEVFDLDKTTANKELMRQFFTATAYSEGAFLQLYRSVAPSDEEWFKKHGPRHTALAAAMHNYAASFIHDALTINATFPTDVAHYKKQLMDNVHYGLVTGFDLLIGSGNFVYLQYKVIGRDMDTTVAVLVSIEDDKIKFIL